MERRGRRGGTGVGCAGHAGDPIRQRPRSRTRTKEPRYYIMLGNRLYLYLMRGYDTTRVHVMGREGWEYGREDWEYGRGGKGGQTGNGHGMGREGKASASALGFIECRC